MADGGEGEDEIQFLRTVSAALRAFSPGKGTPGQSLAGSGQSDSGRRDAPAGRGCWLGDAVGAGISKCVQVCVVG